MVRDVAIEHPVTVTLQLLLLLLANEVKRRAGFEPFDLERYNREISQER